MKRKIAIIGGGPAGYVAAIRAAQLDAEVTLVENRELGGTCLNRGCIPTKAYLKSAHVLREFQDAAQYGLVAEDPFLDFSRVVARKEKIVGQLRGGIAGLLKAAGVRILNGRAVFTAPDAVKVTMNDASELTLKADSFIIATGSSPIRPPIPGSDHPFIMTSDEMFRLTELPDTLLIVGGGVIGVEFATLLSTFGVGVTIVEMEERLLPPFDADISEFLLQKLKRMGVALHLGCKVENFSADDAGVSTAVTLPDGKQLCLQSERVLMSIGRRANTQELGLEGIGMRLHRGRILVDEEMATNISGIYAAGDVNGGMQLAHVASYEGEIAAENAAGHTAKASYKCVPSCVFTFPEIGCAGLTEAEAAEKCGALKIGRFPFNANGKAMIENEAEGFVKIIADADDRIVGVHIAGPQATTMIPEAVLAIEMSAKLADIQSSIHAHPTLAEAMHEAALNANGRAIHIINKP